MTKCARREGYENGYAVAKVIIYLILLASKNTNSIIEGK